MNLPKALNTTYPYPFPLTSSHWAVMTMPIAARKKKFAMKTFFVSTPRHSISERDKVVKVVAKAPIPSAVLQANQHVSAQDFSKTSLKPAK